MSMRGTDNKFWHIECAIDMLARKLGYEINFDPAEIMAPTIEAINEDDKVPDWRNIKTYVDRACGNKPTHEEIVERTHEWVAHYRAYHHDFVTQFALDDLVKYINTRTHI